MLSIKKLKPIKSIGETRTTYGVYKRDIHKNKYLVKEFNTRKKAETFKKLSNNSHLGDLKRKKKGSNGYNDEVFGINFNAPEFRF